MMFVARTQEGRCLPSTRY